MSISKVSTHLPQLWMLLQIGTLQCPQKDQFPPPHSALSKYCCLPQVASSAQEQQVVLGH